MNESSHRLWDLLVKILSAVITIILLLVGLNQYNINSEREFRARVYEEQMKLYSEITTYTSIIATTSLDSINCSRFHNAKVGFENLYFGKLNLVQDTMVENKVIYFYNALLRYERFDPSIRQVHMQSFSFQLAQACRESIQKTWGTELPVLINLGTKLEEQ